MTWKTVVAMVGGQALLLAAIGWLIKALVSEWLRRDTESFKSRLTTDASIEVERLKSSLQMVAAEHQIRFTKLQEKRAEVIAELYERMVNVFWDSQSFALGWGLGTFPEQEEEYDKALARLRDFSEFEDTHRIYLPLPVCVSLGKYVDQLQKAVITAGVWGKTNYADRQSNPEFREQLKKVYNAFRNDIPSLRNILEMEFRKILGVENIVTHV